MSILQPNSPLAKLVAKIKAIPVASSNLSLLVAIALTSRLHAVSPTPILLYTINYGACACRTRKPEIGKGGSEG